MVCHSDVSRKFGKTELCMNVMDFVCINCQQFYSTSLQLQNHIVKEHTQYVCLPCNIEFTSYEGLLTHFLTFCRGPVLLPKCIYYTKILKDCECVKMQAMLYKSIRKFLKRQEGNEIYQIELFSLAFNFLVHYCEPSELEISMQKKRIILTKMWQLVYHK